MNRPERVEFSERLKRMAEEALGRGMPAAAVVLFTLASAVVTFNEISLMRFLMPFIQKLNRVLRAELTAEQMKRIEREAQAEGEWSQWIPG